jgi:hypothetical protein
LPSAGQSFGVGREENDHAVRGEGLGVVKNRPCPINFALGGTGLQGQATVFTTFWFARVSPGEEHGRQKVRQGPPQAGPKEAAYAIPNPAPQVICQAQIVV